MSYQVLARKWRPRNFDEIVGQQHVVKSLTHALLHDRLHHAYLFTGTRGVGKTTLARILAKALNCLQREGYNPCGQCALCQQLDEGRFLDLIEVDGASRTKVEDTRELLENAQYAPQSGKYKVYLIDEVHMLSGHSFNALLKTLEEPPAHVKFVLATTDPQKIPITVLSRCLQFNLKQLRPDQIAGQMQFILQKEQINAEEDGLRLLARAADGSLRDGLSLLDQAIVYGNGQVSTDAVREMLGTIAQHPVDLLLRALAQRDAGKILARIDEIADLSADFADVLRQMLQMLHKMAWAQVVPEAVEREQHPDTIIELARLFTAEDIQLYYQMALLGQRDLELAPDPRGGFEMVMLRMLTFRPVQAEAGQQTPVIPQAGRIGKKSAPEQVAGPASGNANSTAQKSYDWAEMIKAMKLGSMNRELANHCILEKIDDNQCVLSLDPAHKHLLSSRLEQKLQKAIQEYLSSPLKLKIEIKAISEALMTPAVQINQQRLARQQAAEQAIAEDGNIHALKENFDARIIPGSIEPIE